MSRPTSDQAKKAAGTYRPAVGRPPLGVPLGIPEQPTWLSAGAKEVWRSIVPDLSKSGVLARVDWISLAQLAELVAEYAENPREFSVGKHGVMRLLAADLGCSISPRLKMKSQDGAKPIEAEKCKPPEGNVVSISGLLSATRKTSSAVSAQPADTSDSPANAS